MSASTVTGVRSLSKTRKSSKRFVPSHDARFKSTLKCNKDSKKSFFRNHLCEKSTIKCIKTKYNIVCCSHSRAKSQIKCKKKQVKSPILYIHYTAIFDLNSAKKEKSVLNPNVEKKKKNLKSGEILQFLDILQRL